MTASVVSQRRSSVRATWVNQQMQRAMIGTSSPAERSMSGRTVANLLTNLALDPFGQIRDKFCAARAELVGIRTAAGQATAESGAPDRCQFGKGVCGAILFCAMMASARAGPIWGRASS